MSSLTDPHSTSITNNTPEAHKARANSDIINLFKTPPTSTANPSIKGIGLYTHIAAPTNPNSEETPPHPIFLPTPQSPTGKAPSTPTLPEEIRTLCSDLRDLIRDEEAALATRDLSLEELTERYAGLPDPSDETVLVLRERPDVVMQEDGLGRQGMEREVVVQSGSRRTSVDGVGAAVAGGREDVSMRGVEEESARRFPSGTHIYREDPRRKR
ncbi:hypothetical protein COCCADRAFT_95968 [Bipolaris zeicola 26-R-13]|uniref:Uncharacterized protein n=1 Tax=Cochliobolus carbonum (strain 26-R-13) TaxID=930089 RepID=W6YD49_COCC2|nr:uncharacterized protein COCCADRAFT_95968 [Bipolaris zeicola 26-R-13]EUC33434.1 hypothetical protein COCCADRAFT_95968 [Bipolaris zeicola 26-R-13]